MKSTIKQSASAAHPASNGYWGFLPRG